MFTLCFALRKYSTILPVILDSYVICDLQCNANGVFTIVCHVVAVCVCVKRGRSADIFIPI